MTVIMTTYDAIGAMQDTCSEMDTLLGVFAEMQGGNSDDNNTAIEAACIAISELYIALDNMVP